MRPCVYSSVVERCPDKTEVEGSIPSTPTQGLVAQLVERSAYIRKVTGSSPVCPIMQMLMLMQLFCAWIAIVVHYSLSIGAAQPILVAFLMLTVVCPSMCLVAIYSDKPHNGRTWLQNQTTEWCVLVLMTLFMTACMTTCLLLLDCQQLSKGQPVAITFEELRRDCNDICRYVTMLRL